MSEWKPVPAPQDESIGELFSRAVAEAQQVARAEIDLHKARALAVVGRARSGVILLLAALIAASLALVGLVVGVLMILTPRVGPGWATLIVVVTLLVASGLTGWLGVTHFKRMFAADGPSA